MIKIMKAQFFKLRRDKISIITFIGILLVSLAIVMMLADTSVSNVERTGGEEALSTLSLFYLIGQFFMFIVTAQICGADFVDKTCNYEIMSGHTRAQVFLGKAVTAIIAGTIGTMIIIAVPPVVEAIILGWGDKVSFGDFLLRYFLMAFPIARIICEYILLTFLIKNPYIVMGVSYILIILLGIVTPVGSTNNYVLGLTNMGMLAKVDMWTSFGLGGDIYYIYLTELPPDQIITTIVVSLAVGAAALFLGYMFFKNDDMN